MKRLTLALTLLALVALPAAAAAQFAPTPGSTEYLDFLYGWNPGPLSSDMVVGNNGVPYLVGPYTAQFLTGPGGAITSGTFSIYCVDVLHKAKDLWVNSTSIGTGATDASLNLTRLGPIPASGSLLKYTQAAFLSSLFDEGSWQNVAGDKSTAYSVIHSAIWKVVQNQNVGNLALQGDRDSLLSGYAADMNSYKADGWYVLTSTTPSDPKSGQEFLIRTNVIPEPSTYILLATGLLFLVAFGRKRLASRGGGDLAA